MLCQGLPLLVDFEGALVKTALFLAIVGFAWPTRGGRQCWKMGFPADGTRCAFAQSDSLGEGMKSGKWDQAQLRFHECIPQPNAYIIPILSFIGHR